MTRLPILFAAFLALAGACSLGADPIDRALVCGVIRTSFTTPALDNGEAWEWQGEARRLVEASRWTAAGKDLVDSCSGRTSRVDAVAFSEDRSLAQITRNSYPLPGGPDSDLGDMGSIWTCLLRRAKAADIEHWSLVACKLDAVS